MFCKPFKVAIINNITIIPICSTRKSDDIVTTLLRDLYDYVTSRNPNAFFHILRLWKSLR